MHDERTATRLGEAAPEAFEGTPVRFAYLFGSRATGRHRPDSDVDVAVHLGGELPPEQHADLSVRLAQRLSDRSGLGRLEVVILDGAPLALRGRAVRERIVIYSRDEPARVRFEGRTLSQLFDFELHARPLDEALLRATAEGRR